MSRNVKTKLVMSKLITALAAVDEGNTDEALDILDQLVDDESVESTLSKLQVALADYDEGDDEEEDLEGEDDGIVTSKFRALADSNDDLMDDEGDDDEDFDDDEIENPVESSVVARIQAKAKAKRRALAGEDDMSDEKSQGVDDEDLGLELPTEFSSAKSGFRRTKATAATKPAPRKKGLL